MPSSIEQIGFLDIAEIVERDLGGNPVAPIDTLDDVHNFDKQAREIAARLAGRPLDSIPGTGSTGFRIRIETLCFHRSGSMTHHFIALMA
jgi:hypothetical protein